MIKSQEASNKLWKLLVFFMVDEFLGEFESGCMEKNKKNPSAGRQREEPKGRTS